MWCKIHLNQSYEKWEDYIRMWCKIHLNQSYEKWEDYIHKNVM